MSRPMLATGVPPALVTDAWWLDAEPTPVGPRAPRRGDTEVGAWGPRGMGLVILVALADLLFWGHAPGMSLAVFAAALFGVAVALGAPRAGLWRPATVLALAALPVVEHVQALSVGILAVGLVVALVWARGPEDLVRAALGFARALPWAWVQQLDPRRLRGLPDLAAEARQHHVADMLRSWAFPLGGSLVFAALLIEANPVFARLFEQDLDVVAAVERGLFWAGMALFVAPLVLPRGPVTMVDLPEGAGLGAWPARLGINAASVLRALAMFNALIAVQVVSDLSILVGGAALPEGMTYASYAHRGAYPLLATALLAGGFALAARPHLEAHRWIRPLMVLWLGQNLVLCAAAALRLDLYIGAYGLTYLRVHALIWMGLVAVGLGLCLWQALKGVSTGWLLVRLGTVAAVVLYACSFVNFAHVIAAHNVSMERPSMAYICALGPMAAGALTPDLPTWPDCAALEPPAAGAWPSWTYRTWRVRQAVAETGA